MCPQMFIKYPLELLQVLEINEKINRGSLFWASYVLAQKDNNNKKERTKSKSKIRHTVS